MMNTAMFSSTELRNAWFAGFWEPMRQMTLHHPQKVTTPITKEVYHHPWKRVRLKKLTTL